jgi:hypothetical protein
VLVYHRTNHADEILRDGFRDAAGSYGTAYIFRGVWVSAEVPLDEQEGAHGEAVLELDVPESLFVEYEWVEEGKPYREAMIPATDLNKHPRRRLSEDELDALFDA